MNQKDREELKREMFEDEAREEAETKRHLDANELPCEMCLEWTDIKILDINCGVCDKCLKEKEDM